MMAKRWNWLWLGLIMLGLCLPAQANAKPMSLVLIVQANPAQEGMARLLKAQLETALNLVSGLRTVSTTALERRVPDWLTRDFAPALRPQLAQELRCDLLYLIRLHSGTNGLQISLSHYDIRVGKSTAEMMLDPLPPQQLAPEVLRILLLRSQRQPTAIQKQMIDQLLAYHVGSQALRESAQIAAAQGKTDIALDQLAQALALNPESPAIYGERANLKALAGDFGGAVEDFSSALLQVPAWPEALYLRALARSRLDQWPLVIRDLEAAYRLKPDFGPELALLLGKAASEKGDSDKALSYFEQAVTIQTDFAPALHALGEYWLNQKAPAKALGYLDRGLKSATDDEVRYGLLTLRGIALNMLKRNAESLTPLTSAINLAPTRPLAWYLRGLSRAIQRQCPQARFDWSKACSLGQSEACQEICR